MPRLLPLLLALLALAVPAAAETQRVVLRSGEDLFGEVSVQGDVVTVITPSGQRRALLRQDVRSIEGLGPAARSDPSAPPLPADPPVTASADREPGASASPPTSPVEPWYVVQRWSLGAASVAVLALFAAGIARGEARGFLGHLRRARVLFLFFGLMILGIYALDLQDRREQRNNWRRPLHVAVVLLENAPLDPAVVSRFRARASAASERLLQERRRYTPQGDRPFWFHVYGPVPAGERPAGVDAEREDAGLFDRLLYGLSLRRYLSGIDDAAGLDGDRFDARMYVFASPPRALKEPRFVEGQGESGGELGLVDVLLDGSMVDAAWIAILHETLHTVGATDKYDESGRARVPDGLAEPLRTPTYPQLYGEIMAGEIATSPTTGVLMDRLELFRVGPMTAQELRW